MAGSYGYRPLSDTQSDSIRLLFLRCGGLKEPLCAELREVSLSGNPQYVALSYTWASSGASHHLHITSHQRSETLDLRPNVAFVLRKLRDDARRAGSKTVTIWIDAICINQNDAQEKSEQVMRMGKIYSQAESVLVYLGEADESTAIGLEAVKILAGSDKEHRYSYDESEEDDNDELAAAIGDDDDSLIMSDSDVSTDSDVTEPGSRSPLPQQELKRGYRASTDDSLNLSQKKARTGSFDLTGEADSTTNDQCNDGSFGSIDRLQHLDLAAHNHDISRIDAQIVAPVHRSLTDVAIEQMAVDFPVETELLRSLDEKHNLRSILRALSSIFDRPWYSRIWIQQEVVLAQKIYVMIGDHTVDWQTLYGADMVCFHINLRLSRSMGTCAVLEAKRVAFQERIESRSMTETLLSHASYARRVNSTDPRDKIYGWLGLLLADERGVTPDYKIDTKETYTRFVAHLILGYSDLTILATCCPVAHQNLPSWVADFNIKQDDETGQGFLTTSYPAYTAAADSKVAAKRVIDSPDALMLCGMIIDEVAMTSVAFRQKSHLGRTTVLNSSTIELVLSAWIALVKKSCNHPYHDGESLQDAFWTAIVQQRVPYKQNDGHDTWSWSGTNSTLDRLRYHADHGLPMLEDIDSRELIVQVLDEVHRSGFPTTMLTYIAMQLGSLRLFVTKAGRFGLAYYNAAQGDQVALFSGGNMPFLIRQEAQYCRLVSACYIHGIMDGNVWRETRAELRDIELR